MSVACRNNRAWSHRWNATDGEYVNDCTRVSWYQDKIDMTTMEETRPRLWHSTFNNEDTLVHFSPTQSAIAGDPRLNGSTY